MPKSRERWEGGAIRVGKMDEMIKALTPPERGLENAKMSVHKPVMWCETVGQRCIAGLAPKHDYR